MNPTNVHVLPDDTVEFAPSVPLLPRDRLFTRIERPYLAPVTLISSPAGYGKSTLALQWTQASSRTTAWIAVCAELNHPLRFLNRLMEALPPEMRHHIHQAGSEVSTDLVIEAMTAEPLTIVLDDVHLIESQDVLQVIDALLHSLPPGCHVLLLSRTQPPLTLARLRANGHLREITESDLSFTRDEAEIIVSRELPHRLTSEQTAHLVDRTEGWITGIRLAMMALAHHRGDARSIIDSLPAHHWLDDYIIEEVLGMLPDDLRTFVLRTAMLDYLDPALCDHVLDITTSAALIAELRTRLIFVRPHANALSSLAYHALFAESVSRIASRTSLRQEQDELHMRAALWFQQQDRPEEAVEYAVKAGAWDIAEAAVRQVCQTLIDSDQSHSALYWLQKLPEERLLATPLLARWYISRLQYTGQIRAAAEAFERADAIWQESGDPVHLGYSLLCRVFFAMLDDHPDDALQMSYAALNHFSPESANERLHIWACINQLEFLRGNDEVADAAYRQASITLKHLPADQWWWMGHIETNRANQRALRGDLQAAAEMYTYRITHLSVIHRGAQINARYRRAAIYLEWNDLDRALAETLQVEQGINDLPHYPWHPEALHLIAQVQGATGDITAMEATMLRARSLIRDHGGQLNLHRHEALEVSLWRATGRGAIAQDWARRVSMESFRGVRILGDPDPRLAIIQTSLDAGAHASARDHLDALILEATAARRWAELVALAMWQVVVCGLMDDNDGAVTALRLALRHGRPGGFVRSFMTPGYDPTPVLRYALPRLDPEDAAYLTGLLGQNIWTSASGVVAQPISPPLHDPLSPREIDVLKLMAPGLLNREIGEMLFISERTVKKHVGNILRKLGVQNRTAAVDHARIIGILDDPIA